MRVLGESGSGQSLESTLAARVGEVRTASQEAESAEDTRCIKCGGLIGSTGQWHSNTAGGLYPYCGACARVEFAVP